MAPSFRARIRPTLFLLSLCTLTLTSARAQFKPEGSLKVINTPTGGQIAYAPLTQVSTMPQAMGFMLRTIHVVLGDRPQVSKFFQAKGTNSVAAFFTLNAKSMGGKPITGMVIVSMPPNGAASAAVVYDDQKHFNASAMLKKLNTVWHPEGAATSSGPNANGQQPAGPSGPVASLRRVTFPDNSGSVSLPAGWRITAGYGGTVHAEGPGGEQIHYGVNYPVMNTNNPQTRQNIQMETQGGRVPLPGMYVAYPYGGDPAQAFVAIDGQTAQKSRRPAPSYRFTSEKNVGRGAGGSNCTLATGFVDRHDGKGQLTADTIICTSQTDPGNWMMSVYQTNLKPENAAQEKATMDAVSSSYRVDNGVISGQVQATISNIHKIGEDSARNAAESHAAFDKRNADLAANEDSRDKRYQAFDNNILDYSVIEDTNTGGHVTTYNGLAEELVQSNNSHFQYVPTQDFMKGIDY